MTWHALALWGAVTANVLCALALHREARRYRRMAQDLQEYLWTNHGAYWEDT